MTEYITVDSADRTEARNGTIKLHGPEGFAGMRAAGRPGSGPELRPGMFFTIEPMINIGKPACKILDDGWTAVTRDRSLSAQFEHSVGITEDGCEIFTKSPKGLDRPPY